MFFFYIWFFLFFFFFHVVFIYYLSQCIGVRECSHEVDVFSQSFLIQKILKVAKFQSNTLKRLFH